jgi:hypothetical protein
MIPKNIDKLTLKRVNPFQGLIIDDAIWRDSHEYHRNHQRLHSLAIHGPGIIAGLEVTANQSPDLSIIISPGIGIDPEGNTIIVTKPQNYQILTRDTGTIYIIIQFREIPTGPYQPPEGGQPTRILEAYRIQERNNLPDEPYLELARIDFNPGNKAIHNASNPYQPETNQIDNRFRHHSVGQLKRTVTIWHYSTEPEKRTHLFGLANLAREISQLTDIEAVVNTVSTLGGTIANCNVLYIAGRKRFELDSQSKTNINLFLKGGGVIVGEACVQDQQGARDFGIAFNQLARENGYRLEMVNQGHPLLNQTFIFSSVPVGANPESILLASPRMIYSGSDYGCAWEGGRAGSPLSREVIRSAFEIGTNIFQWGQL